MLVRESRDNESMNYGIVEIAVTMPTEVCPICGEPSVYPNTKLCEHCMYKAFKEWNKEVSPSKFIYDWIDKHTRSCTNCAVSAMHKCYPLDTKDALKCSHYVSKEELR
jgi:hypothetical protein